MWRIRIQKIRENKRSFNIYSTGSAEIAAQNLISASFFRENTKAKGVISSVVYFCAGIDNLE